MQETFYAALGVDPDADDATVRTAYREAVKEHHPDVSDDPGAEQRFKRLTTARDVLLDPDERARYDRIGHEAYVADHLEAPTWSGTAPGGAAGQAGGPTGQAGGSAGKTGGAAGKTGGAAGRAGGSTGQAGGAANHERSGASGRGTGTAGRGADATDAADRRRARAAERAAWFGDDESTTAAAGAGDATTGPTPGSRRHRAAAGRRGHVRTDADGAGSRGHGGTTATAAGVDEPWQTASDAYTRSAAASRAAATKSGETSLGEMVAALGPWLVIHVVFIASAVATVVFALTEATPYMRLSLPAFLLALLLFGLVIGLSVLHLVSQVVS